MRQLLGVLAGALVLGGVAYAQSAAPASDKGYAEAIAQASFGGTSSQSYGAEVGVTVAPNLQVFIEGGHANNVASTAFVEAAEVIASGLEPQQSGAGFSAKEPTSFGVAGVRYVVPTTATRIAPYVTGGFGVARVTQDATFTVNGTDVTANLAQYAIVLGTDLSGTLTRPMLTLGGGVAVPVSRRFGIDLQYRYGRIFMQDQAINVSRAGLGIGIRF